MCSAVIISSLHIIIRSLVLLLMLLSCCWFPSWSFSDHRGRQITQNWNMKNQKFSKNFHHSFYLNMLNLTEKLSVKSECCYFFYTWMKLNSIHETFCVFLQRTDRSSNLHSSSESRSLKLDELMNWWREEEEEETELWTQTGHHETEKEKQDEQINNKNKRKKYSKYHQPLLFQLPVFNDFFLLQLISLLLLLWLLLSLSLLKRTASCGHPEGGGV